MFVNPKLARGFFIAILSLFVFSIDGFSQTRILKYNTNVNANIPGYYVYLPEAYQSKPQQKFPLILYLNGIGSTGDGSPGTLERIISHLWGSVADRSYRSPGYFKFPLSFTSMGRSFEFIIATPQFRTEAWSTSTRDINDMLDHLINNYHVDQSRIYLAGQSAGAIYVLNYIGSSLENARRIAAVFSASPAGELSQEKANNFSLANVGLWIAAAEADPQYGGPGGAVRYAQNTINRVKNATPKPKTTPWITIVTDPKAHHGTAGGLGFNPDNRQNGLNVYEWMLQYSQASVLPVTGLNLAARTVNNAIKLDWTSESEKNSSSYTVQTSDNATDFKDLWTTASANTGTGSSYAYLVTNPASGVNYFRIKHQDIDGAISYSNIVSIRFASANAARISVYPNPAVNALTIDLGRAPVRPNTIRIYDVTGKLFKEFKNNQNQRPVLDVSSFPRGVYTGKVIGDDEAVDFKFIKQ